MSENSEDIAIELSPESANETHVVFSEPTSAVTILNVPHKATAPIYGFV